MSTYTSKTKVSETKQQFIEESNRQKRQTLLTIILIFFLILLLLFSVLISNKFTITSMDVRKSNKQLEFSYYEVGKIDSQQQPITVVEKPKETEPPKTSTINVQQTPKTQATTMSPTSITEPKITSSEKRVGIDGKIITSKNIKTYHSRLLKEFEGKEIETYKIVWGDTLWKIALKFNTSAHTLYVLNALDNPDLIIAGKYLKIVKNFILPKERTEKILEEALKGSTSLNINNSIYKTCIVFTFGNLISEKNQNIFQESENI